MVVFFYWLLWIFFESDLISFGLFDILFFFLIFSLIFFEQTFSRRSVSKFLEE